MSPEEVVPSPVPSPVPNPIGPALSYSTVRAMTTRAQTALNGLESKVRKHLQNSLDAAGRIGAMAETKVLTRLSDALGPPEQLFSELDDHLKNQLAAGMAPSVALLQDLGEVQGPVSAMGISAGAAPSRATVHTGETAAPGQPTLAGVSATSPTMVTQPVGQAVFQPVSSPSVIRPGPVQPLAQCTPPEEPESDRLKAAAIKFRDSLPVKADEIYLNYDYLGTPDCCVCIGRIDQPDCTVQGQFALFLFGPPLQASMVTPMRNYLQNLWQPNAKCGQPPPPVDCKAHPYDPSCPPDCVNHPEDPRCQPPCPTQPCVIDVTCPPPVINIPPCPTLPPPPSCTYIDLCDYDKFCKSIIECLIKSKEDCALDNDTAYVFKDCDGTFGQAQTGYWGTAADNLDGAATVTDAVQPTSVLSGQLVQVTSIGRDMFGTLQPA